MVVFHFENVPCSVWVKVSRVFVTVSSNVPSPSGIGSGLNINVKPKFRVKLKFRVPEAGGLPESRIERSRGRPRPANFQTRTARTGMSILGYFWTFDRVLQRSTFTLGPIEGLSLKPIIDYVDS